MQGWMTTAGHKRWLLVTAVVVGAFGPVFALGSNESTAGAARWTLDVLNGPGGDAESFADGTTRFLTALTGGFLLGWGVMIFGLRQWVFDSAPDGVRKSVLAGLLSWFVLDSAGSLASGNPWNVLFNLLVLLTAIGPLWFPARD